MKQEYGKWSNTDELNEKEQKQRDICIQLSEMFNEHKSQTFVNALISVLANITAASKVHPEAVSDLYMHAYYAYKKLPDDLAT